MAISTSLLELSGELRACEESHMIPGTDINRFCILRTLLGVKAVIIISLIDFKDKGS